MLLVFAALVLRTASAADKPLFVFLVGAVRGAFCALPNAPVAATLVGVLFVRTSEGVREGGVPLVSLTAFPAGLFAAGLLGPRLIMGQYPSYLVSFLYFSNDLMPPKPSIPSKIVIKLSISNAGYATGG